MNLYEIDYEIMRCIDAETGEVVDLERLEQLQMEKAQKVENIALWIKDLKAESDAIAAEVKELQHRKKVADNKAESLKAYLSEKVYGEKWSSARYSIGWRTSKSVEIEDEEKFIAWAQRSGEEDLLRYKDPEISKTAIKEALEAGKKLPLVAIVQKTNIQIK